MSSTASGQKYQRKVMKKDIAKATFEKLCNCVTPIIFECITEILDYTIDFMPKRISMLWTK